MRKRKFLSNEAVSDVFIVETIYKKKIRSNKEPLYFIKWKDWDDKFNTWEPQSNILDKSLIDIFEEEQREKQKGKKEAKPAPPDAVKELDISPVAIETKAVVETIIDKSNVKPEKEEKLDKICNESEIRPKICLKIPKHRIHAPCADIIRKPRDHNFFDQDIEKSRKCSNLDDDWRLLNKVSPNCFSNDESVIKSSADNSLLDTKLSTKQAFHLNRHIQNFTEQLIRKPRKLLSINEYSAKMKKHHKKSRQDKHKSQEKKSHLFFKHEIDGIVSLENKIEQKPESKSVRQQHERPLISLENQIECWSEKSVEKDRFCESVKEDELKPAVERFKYHANTIVTDVTIRNLSITIREMPYEDFIDCDTSRYLMVRVPIQSDWLVRFRGHLNKNTESDNDSEIEEINEVFEEDKTEVITTLDKKQKLLERFTDAIIPGLRPPSRPRSVDSYKAAIDRNFPGGNRNPFSANISPIKSCVYNPTVSNIGPSVLSKSPLQVVVDDCEEVDVVGGIESDHSFVGSLQAERVTVSTQILQSIPINTSPVTSIIQSLLQSYSYNHSMMMPQLQPAPWIDSHHSASNMYQMPHHHNNTNDNNNIHMVSTNPCLPQCSNESNLLKFNENACLSLYRTASSPFPDIYRNSQDTPIDLSFK